MEASLFASYHMNESILLKRHIRLFTFHNQKFEILISLNEILLKLRQQQEDRKLFHL